MKTLNIYAAILISIFAINISFAQKSTVLNTKEQFKVWGNCDMCKKRIEGAAINSGAATAYWSDQTHILSVSFDGAKTSLLKIQKAIALAGYDTQDLKGSDDAYNNLPSCCKYDRTLAFKNALSKHDCKMECCKDKTMVCKEEKCKDDDGCKDMVCCKS